MTNARTIRCPRRPLRWCGALRGACWLTLAACGTEATVLGLNPLPQAGSATATDASTVAPLDSGIGTPSADSPSEAAADQCAPCSVGQPCSTASDCRGSVGAACSNGLCALSRTCAEILSRAPGASDGVYTVDVDGLAAGLSAFPVYCDMTSAGGGWTRVAFEPARSGGDHIQGNLAYLGVEIGAPDAVANGSGPGLIGMRFNGRYHEMAVTWGPDYARMTVSKDIFVNQVDVAMSVGNFVTSNATLGGWVSAAGGAILSPCLAIPRRAAG